MFKISKTRIKMAKTKKKASVNIPIDEDLVQANAKVNKKTGEKNLRTYLAKIARKVLSEDKD